MRMLIAAVIGAVVGYLFRPSVPFIGQLPLETVLTRGENLRGLDVVLRGVAERSFNYIVVGVIVGALLGFVLLQLTPKPQTSNSRS